MANLSRRRHLRRHDPGEQRGEPPVLTRPLVTAWVADQLTAGASPASAATYLAGVRQFSKWLAREGELPTDPLLGMASPKSDVPVTPVLSEDDLKRLIKACQGPRLKDRRDEAIIRLMANTGMRIGECCALDVADVDVVNLTATIRRGKGGRGRIVPFDPTTARANVRSSAARTISRPATRWL